MQNGLNGYSIVKHTGQNFTEEEKAHAIQLFIEAIEQTGVLVQSCKAAGISFVTYQKWMKEDENFKVAIQLAQQVHQELIYREVDRRGREGILKPLVSGGKLVKHDNKPVYIREYSDQLLALQFKRFYSEKRESQPTGLVFTSGQETTETTDLFVHLPWGLMTEEEKALIERIGQAIERRETEKGISHNGN